MKIKVHFYTTVKIIVWIVLTLAAIQTSFAVGVFNVSSSDTISGYSALIKTSQIEANTEIDFLVKKPNEAEIKLQAKTNSAGFAETEIFGYNTKKAGLYTISAKRKTEQIYTNQNSFRVYADTLSSSQSILSSDKTTASGDGSEKVYLTVTLTDKYRNAISNHQVKLISSRPEDEITLSSQSISDANGSVVFELTSRYPGISVYSAFDVNTGITLDDRIKIVYFTPYDNNLPIGGNYLQADIFSSDNTDSNVEEIISGPVKYFDITILDEVPVNTAQTIKITARDSNQNIAKDYTGTILFATPDDENATLPSEDGEFTFSDTDRGEFTFNLAMTFTKLGMQDVQVFDSDDWSIKGEQKINVVEQNGSSQTPDPVGTLEIKTPTDNSELSTKTINVLGKGSANDQLKIFDNDVKIGETEVDSDGVFTFTATTLSEGLHVIYAKGVEDVSSSINITIDSTPPVIDSFTINPEGEIETSSSYKITIQSEPNLRTIQVRINGIPEQMVESSQEKGKYEVTLIAPQIGWDYSLDVILTDYLGNKGEYLNKGLLNVKKAAIPLPPKVTGLRAQTDDKKINLTWDNITEHTSTITKYRIYSGESENALSKITETNGAVNQWYIANLENSKRYYFAITAIDNQGFESTEKSLIVNAIPQEKESLVRAVASDTKVTLSWKSFGQNPSRYKIKYGIQSNQYTESIITIDNRTTWYLPDLINGVSYYFQVVPLDSSGNEQTTAPEVSATPFGAGFKPVAGGQNYVLPQTHEPQGDTGPEMWIVVVFSLLFIDVVLRVRKKLI